MTEQNAELFEIGVAEVSQDIGIDAVVAERRLVLPEPRPRSHSPTFMVTFPGGSAMIVQAEQRVQRISPNCAPACATYLFRRGRSGRPALGELFSKTVGVDFFVEFSF
jgi:hypothetical protein